MTDAAVFAEAFVRALVEAWLDQHGIEAEIIIERKES